ncbi:MAG: hypothetical protein GYB66_13265 [Chloroflexi bacterium]|nr:hypothetical protein [Chloroflexota bacterium]
MSEPTQPQIPKPSDPDEQHTQKHEPVSPSSLEPAANEGEDLPEGSERTQEVVSLAVPSPPKPPPPPPAPLPPAEHAPFVRPQSPAGQQITTPSASPPAPPPPAAPSKARPPRRRSVRRGVGCTPSCLIGCLGIAGSVVIVTLVAIWLIWTDYSNRLDDRLDEFEQRADEQAFGSTFIYDRQGTQLYEVIGEGRREPIDFEQIPDVVKYATIALEDDTFYDNTGVDVPSILRASRDYLQEGQIVSGASTITQQLVREVLFEDDYRYERTLRRKIDEALLAIVLTQRMEKDLVLEMYLNTINYGNLAYGIEAAAKTYFGKSAQQLELHEAALLAALPQAPAYLNPLNPNPDVQQLVIARQHLVLDLMAEEGYITPAQAEAAKNRELVYASPEIPLD